MSAERTAALAYLEHLQRSVYKSLGIERNWMKAEHAQFREAFLAKLYKSDIFPKGQLSYEDFQKMAQEFVGGGETASRSSYQDPALHALMAKMIDEIEQELNQRGISLSVQPIFGSLPTGRVNGLALRVPNSEQLIVLIEDGLFGFANLAAKAVSRILPVQVAEDGLLTFSIRESDWKKELAAHPEGASRFLELLLAYVSGGHPHLARPYLPERHYDSISSLLRDATELFVLCHEYGHFVSGHLDAQFTRKAMVGHDDADEVITNWMQEFEADARGLQIMLAVMSKRGFDLSLSFIGADFFFGCVEIVERAVSILRTGRADLKLAASHPPTMLRRENLRRLLQHTVPAEQADAPLGLAGILASILDEFWRLCEPVLLRAYTDGLELAPAWRETTS